jgi:hypothetical protein
MVLSLSVNGQPLEFKIRPLSLSSLHDSFPRLRYIIANYFQTYLASERVIRWAHLTVRPFFYFLRHLIAMREIKRGNSEVKFGGRV